MNVTMHPSASQSLLAPRPSKITGYLAVSAGLHAAVVGVLLVLSWLMASPRIDLDQKPIIATLVRQGKKREEKLLPRKEESPPPAPEKVVPIPSPDAKPAPKIEPKKNADPTQKDQKKSLFDAINKAAKPDEPEGEENGDPHGDSAKQEGERYYGLINSAVRRYYDVSNTIPESERLHLAAIVVIRLDGEGGLLEVRVAKPSGNETYDSAVVGAIKKAAPFGPPPANLAAALKKDGVQLRFTP